MTKLYIVPIEPLAERYTEQWYRRIPEYFSSKDIDVEVIDGYQHSDTVSVGTFLDINTTIMYKNSQMINIAKMFSDGSIENGSIFFFFDTEFWGLESLRLMADMNNISIKIYSFLHAASYTLEDAFAIAAPYQKYTELGWIQACDGVFVGSAYHKQAVLERRVLPFAAPSDVINLTDKIHVVGNPLFLDEYKEFNVQKTNKVILPNRFDWEKRPNISLSFAYILKRKHPDWEFVITTSRSTFKSNRDWLVSLALEMEKDGIVTIKYGLSKEEYHKEIASSKVMLSNSIEESYGYCVAEALVYGTHPLCPNTCSHPEIVDFNHRYLFNNDDEIVEKIEYLMNTNDKVTVNHLLTSLNKMYEIMF